MRGPKGSHSREACPRESGERESTPQAFGNALSPGWIRLRGNDDPSPEDGFGSQGEGFGPEGDVGAHALDMVIPMKLVLRGSGGAGIHGMGLG